MQKEIQIGGKTINFVANAATPLYYKQFFKKDLLQLMTKDEDGLTVASENVPELAFIMAKQADKADMMHLTFKHYVEWLELFDPLDLIMSSEGILSVYFGDLETDVEPKKKVKEEAKE